MPTNAKGPFRADHVGSLLRPAKLQQARMQRLRKNITAERLREIEDESIREVVKLQEDAGLEGITDGELRRDYCTSISSPRSAASCSKKDTIR
jgi:5-methyltetrahydropteroyltriglutamate--homocysteine methyltransferase